MLKVAKSMNGVEIGGFEFIKRMNRLYNCGRDVFFMSKNDVSHCGDNICKLELWLFVTNKCRLNCVIKNKTSDPKYFIRMI
jgi:hypothetical protein